MPRSLSIQGMSNSIKVWTIQNHQFLAQTLKHGRAIQTWEYVDEPFRLAYRWLTEQMAMRELPTPGGAPPVWSWHSCGAFQHPPTEEDVEMFLGAPSRPELDLVLIELLIDPKECLILRYGPWSDFLRDTVSKQR